MPSPPNWPPTPCALRPSPFPHPVLHALHRLTRALLFPAYWALDQLLGCWAPAESRSEQSWLRTAAGAAGALLLLLAALPLTLPALLLWLLLQAWRRPFCYQPPPRCWAPPAPWCPRTEPARSFGFFSANLCLLPDGLARFNNLPHTQRRAAAVGAVLLAGLRSSPYGATGCGSPVQAMPCGVLTGAMPASLDFVCLQEAFDLRAERRLVSLLASNLGPVLYDVGTFGLQHGLHLKLLGSGLLLASRYPLLRAAFQSFPHARGEDALASKGLLSAQAQLGILDGRRVVGFLHCTHLHAPSEDGLLRCKQLTVLLDWAGQFEAESRQSDEAVAFSVLLGDLNFDNCSLDHQQEQEHQFFSCFRDPCRLGTRREQPWALGTLLRPSELRRSVACSPEMLLLAGPAPGLHHLPQHAWRPSEPGKCQSSGCGPEVEQVTFSTALAGLTDHLAVGLRLRVSTSS
uniref:sphingomyelin phosphodiesterase n=1 Tax=Capra hircus TaxID=9925 RepID=A0A452FLP2_CAPHI